MAPEVSHVLRIVVIILVNEPVAAAAAGDIGTDHAAMPGQGLGKKIEVATVTRETMNADNKATAGRVAPVGDRKGPNCSRKIREI